MDMLPYWVWLSLKNSLGSVKILRLIEKLKTPLNVYEADKASYEDVEGITAAELKTLADKDLDRAQRTIDRCLKQGFDIMTIDEVRYPERLINIYAPPIVLYIAGKLPDIDDEICIAMVGTRNCSVSGLLTAEKLSCALAQEGAVIISGMAKGIDSAAHKGALKGNGKTVAVLGCGLDIIYPPENKELMKYIISCGAVISEYEPGREPFASNFPQRNRIISGLSLGTCVVEAGEKSGALITSSIALEQGRDVFAIPGNIESPTSIGCNNLIKNGAKLVSCASDIMDEYKMLFPHRMKGALNIKPTVSSKPSATLKTAQIADPALKGSDLLNTGKIKMEDFSENEKGVYALLTDIPMHIDEIVLKSGLPVNKVVSSLTILEMEQRVVQSSGKFFRIKFEVQ